MTYHAADPITISRILDLVRPELRNVASRDELKRRLARLGYGFSDTVVAVCSQRCPMVSKSRQCRLHSRRFRALIGDQAPYFARNVLTAPSMMRSNSDCSNTV